MKILVIEDEIKTAKAIKEGLETEHYHVSLAATGEEGLFAVNSQGFDLVILDLMLPGKSGLDVLNVVRARGEDTPVLVLTARDSIEDRVTGLDFGADDYMVKPFAFMELAARVRALLRRRERSFKLNLADLEMDLISRHVKRAGNTIELTAKEFELLEFLLKQQNRVVSRDLLASEVWKDQARVTPLDNVIDVHIARLRKKIDQGFALKLIHTERGAGYILRAGGP